MTPRRINHTHACATIQNGDHLNARSLKITRCALHIVVVAKNGDTRTRRHAPAIDIGTHGPCHHDARTVIVRKRNRAFQ